MRKNISIRPPIVASIVLLLLASFPFPYGYYTLLRLVVCSTAVFLGWFSYKKQKVRWVWIMGLIALIFNPVIPIHFNKRLWIVLDLIGAGVFSKFLLEFYM